MYPDDACCPSNIQTPDDLEIHWAAEMALRLLQQRHACRKLQTSHSSSSSSKSSNSSSGGDGCFWQPWISSLPASVVTPVEFTDEEVELLVLPSAQQVGCM
jgi:hypothetical protein